jgi:TonB-linked SusC/RagA family outer membrane protein
MSALAQKAVTGVVADDSGELLPGASVVIQGTTQGVITDIDGKFSISVPDASSVLLISFVGMETQEIAVGNQTEINVVLASSTIGIDDVIVTALGISREKKSLGYDVSTVNNDDINQGGSVNVLKSLEGKVTGVNITNLSSDPTSSAFITIRGATSIAGWNNRNSSNAAQPLYVIDGIPVGKGSVGITGSIDVGNIMSELNPEDIESISILKGASAGALYGSQAGNGVIMITTKTGASGKKGIGVSINSSLVFDNVYKTLEVQNEYHTGDRWNDYSTHENSANGPKVGSPYSLNNTFKQWDVVNQKWFDGPLPVNAPEDRIKEFMQTGYTLTNSVSVAGNYDEGNYRFSFTNLENEGVVPNNKTNRNTVNFSGAYNITDDLKISTSATYTRTFVPNKTNISSRGGERDGIIEHLYAMTPSQPSIDVMREAGYWIDGYEGKYQNAIGKKDKGDQYDAVNGEPDQIKKNNPFYIVNEMIQTYSRENIFGKAQLDYSIAEPLVLTLRSGMNKTSYNYQQRISWGNEKRPTGQFKTNNTMSTRVNSDLFLTFDENFGNLNVNAMAGFNHAFSESFSSRNGGRDLARPGDFTLGALSSAQRFSNEAYGFGSGRTYSAYATASLGFNNMLYVDLSARQDWIGLTELTKNSHLYPSASVSAVVSEMLELPEAVDIIKVRGGWAQVGHGITSYINRNSYGFNSYQWGIAQLGTVGGALIDPTLEPEINDSKEIGIEMAFGGNRIMAEFTTYDKNHINQIGQIPTNSSSGYSSMTTNIGTVNSKGIEASLTLVPVRTKDIEWSVTGNISTNESVITELSVEDKWVDYGDETVLRLREGEEIGQLWTWRGLERVQGGKHDGELFLLNNRGVPSWNFEDPEYRDLLGNYNPDYIAGIRTNLRIKRFTLDATGSYRSGGVYVSRSSLILLDDGKGLNSVTLTGDRWAGGRHGAGGFAWPNPDDHVFGDGDKIKDEMAIGYSEGIDDASYYNGVFVDPRSGLEDALDYGDQTFIDPASGEELPVYIKNGENPLTTYYRRVEEIVGNTWDFANFRTYDATNFKLKEVTLSYSIPRSVSQKIKCDRASLSLIAKNVYFWTKSGLNEDPETAFDGVGSNQGIARFGLPSVRSWGVKLNLNF